MKTIEDINKANLEKLISKKKITEFFPGDTIRVRVRIIEGKMERVQNFEGVCIAKKNRNINSSFIHSQQLCLHRSQDHANYG